MKDIVYKRDVIDAVKTYWKANVDAIPKDTDFDTMTDICNTILRHNAEICRALDHLPSAQPQRKVGRWEMCEDSEGEYGVCSECGCDADFSRFVETYEFCPWCGARMEGESDE